MAKNYIIGGRKIEAQPLGKHTDDEVKKLIESGEFVAEVYPKHVIKDKTDEEYADYRFV